MQFSNSKNYDNLGACMCWLRMMYDKPGGPSLLGNSPEAVARAVSIYDIGRPFMFFYAEIPFIGEPGVDISAEYMLDWFSQENLLQDGEAAPEGEFFRQYAQLLNRQDDRLLQDLSCFLEADTSKKQSDSQAFASASSQFAIFMNNGEQVFQPFLADILAWQQLSQRQPDLERIFALVSAKAKLWNFGFMNSRPGRPIRLDFHGRNYPSGTDNTQDMLDLLDAAQLLGLDEFIACAASTLRLIDSLHIFGVYTLDVEVLEDGSISPRVGFEMRLPAPYPTLQRSVLRSVQFKRFMDHLVEQGMADQRIYTLLNSLLAQPLAHPDLNMYHVYSYISHLKLVWLGGKPQLGKVYLEMYTIDRQYTINDSLSAVYNRVK